MSANTENDSEPPRIVRWLEDGKSTSFRRFVLNGYFGWGHELRIFLGAFLWIILSTVLSVQLWRFLGEPLGDLGGYIGIIPCSIVVLALFWLVILGRLMLFYPFPTCRQGKCHRFEDYTWPWPTIYGHTGLGSTHVYYCKCGGNYVRLGKRFTELLPDNSKVPYKKLTGFRTWRDDTDPIDDD